MTDTLLRVDGVAKYFGRRPALRDFCLRLERGEVVGLLGPNGSGKTTALRIVAGVLACDRGRIERPGAHAAADAPVELGYLPEGAPLYRGLRVRDTIDFVARCKRMGAAARRDAVEHALTTCDLEHWSEVRVGQLSKGTRQRVALALALLGDPPLLLLDEATSGLDPLQARHARGLILEGHSARATLFSTHVLQEAAALCSRVLILHQGRVVAQHRLEGSPADDTAPRAAALEAAFLGALGETSP